MVKGLRKEAESLILFLPLAIVSVLLVFLMGGSGMAGSGGVFESPTSPFPISPIPIPSPLGEEAVGPSMLPPLIGVRTQPNYLPWVLGGLVIIGGVVGVRLYRRGRGDEG
ncbi:MAG: hypothetical protein ACE5II_00980 [Anaerolineae bacterium]